MTAAAAPTDLRPVDLFDELDDDALAEWARAATSTDVPAGTVIAEQGGNVPGLQLLLDGEVLTLVVTGAMEETVHRQQAPTWMGAIAALTGEPSARAAAHRHAVPHRVHPARRVPPARVRASGGAQPRSCARSQRVADFVTGIERNRERLASLGQMAAGLAHELNNPAAAAQRAAMQLQEAMEVVTGRDRGVRERRRRARGRRRCSSGCSARRSRDGVAHRAGRAGRGRREEALLDRLEDLGVADAWRLAEPLAVAGVDEHWIDALVDAAGPARDAALRWVGGDADRAVARSRSAGVARAGCQTSSAP